MNELALFTGAGGGLLASDLLGFNTVCGVEIDEFCRNVIFSRQRQRQLRTFPLWDDVSTFDGHPWRGKIDIITGGFPCQDISAAGTGTGLAGSRSGLWSEYARIIDEVKPSFVFAENSPLLRTRGLGTIIKDLDSLGYAARWCVLGAWHVGANHKRNRMWILAHAHSQLRNVPKPEVQERQTQHTSPVHRTRLTPWWRTEPKLGRVADGVANRVDRIKAIGNGQVPTVAAVAFKLLSHNLL